MPRFTPTTEAALIAAGWFEGRTISDEQMNDWLIINWLPTLSAPYGYSKISPLAWQALNEFGGLSIPRLNGEDGGHPFVVNPLLVPDSGYFSSGLEGYSWQLGTDVFPLGTIQFDTVSQFYPSKSPAVVMGNDGRFFLIGHPNLLIGKNIDSALEQLIAGKLGKVFSSNLRRSKLASQQELAIKIGHRIQERDEQLMQGKWPDQPTTLGRGENTGFYAISNWDAEAAQITSAFGITSPCEFVGHTKEKKLCLRAHPNDVISLGGDLLFSMSLNSLTRFFTIYQMNTGCLAFLSLRWDGEVIHATINNKEAALILAKSLFNLGLLTSKVEEKLKLTITQHEKLEWQLEFEAKDSS